MVFDIVIWISSGKFKIEDSRFKIQKHFLLSVGVLHQRGNLWLFKKTVGEEHPPLAGGWAWKKFE